jgi:small subunit ribosomal protein S17
MIGRVVSVKSAKTATVIQERLVKHPLYKKTYVQSKKYLVDDPLGVNLGDIVNFINCKPVSKNKHWRVTKILGKNFAEIAEGHLKEGAEQAISEVMPEEKKEKEVVAKNSEVEVVVEEAKEKSKLKKKSGVKK